MRFCFKSNSVKQFDQLIVITWATQPSDYHVSIAIYLWLHRHKSSMSLSPYSPQSRSLPPILPASPTSPTCTNAHMCSRFSQKDWIRSSRDRASPSLGPHRIMTCSWQWPCPCIQLYRTMSWGNAKKRNSKWSSNCQCKISNITQCNALYCARHVHIVLY